MCAEKLIRVDRGNFTESVHSGHIAVVDRQGRLLHSAGDFTYKTFARSSAKLLQALAVLEAGADVMYGMDEREIAVLCASHSGQPEHVAAVRNVLGKLGIDESALHCGVHRPLNSDAAEQLAAEGKPPLPVHNNCSGKHAGMLALALRLGAPLDGYSAPEHPVQRAMLAVVSAMCGLQPHEVELAVDGCGVPVFGMPLDRLAYAYARLGAAADADLGAQRAAACRTVLYSLAARPFYLAGDDRFDTLLIEATKGRIIGKMGAEGVFALTVPDAGIGAAVKIEDGAERAVYPAVVETLQQLQLLQPDELEKLRAFHSPDVINRLGDKVGYVQPVFTLKPSPD